MKILTFVSCSYEGTVFDSGLEVERAMAHSARLASWLDIGRLVFDLVHNQASSLSQLKPKKLRDWETDQAKRLVFWLGSSSLLVKPAHQAD